MNIIKNSETNNRDLQSECLAFMAEHGICFSGPILADNQIHRFSADEHKNKPDEWYKATEGVSIKGNKYLMVTVGSWSTGAKYTYCSWKDDNSLDASEKKEMYEFSSKHNEEAGRQLDEIRDLAAKEAERIWQEATDSTSDEQYLRYIKLKSINPIGVKFGLHKMFGKDKDPVPVIIIDFRNAAGEIRTLQFIHTAADGKTYKKWLTGGEKKGNFHLIGEAINNSSMFVTEGYATGVSVFMASGTPVAVAGDAGNLSPAIENLKIRHTQSKFTIAGDSDERGRKDANEAAKKIGVSVVFPIFPEDVKSSLLDPMKKPAKDFNDLHQIHGLEEVKKQLLPKIVISSVQDDLKNLASNLTEKCDPCEDFILSGMPELLYAWISSLCETTDAHPIMITTSAFATATGFIGKKMLIPRGLFHQDLHTNMWFLNVADSGLFKSTALKAGANIAYDCAKEVNKDIRKFAELRRTESDNTEKMELDEKILQLRAQNIILPTKATGEAFIERLSLQGKGGVILLNELGAWLQNFEKNHNIDFKGMLTEFYDVPDSYEYATRTQGTFILEKPCFSICGVSTSVWLKENLKPNDVGSGFFARFLIYAPPCKNKIPPAFPKKFISPNKYEQRVQEILYKFNESDYIYNFELTETSKGFAEELYQEIFKLVSSYDKCNKILEPYVKRWWPYLLKLGMVISFFEDQSSTEISETSLMSAFTILLPAIKSTAYLFQGELGESDYQMKCRTVFNWICVKVKECGAPVKRKKLLQSKILEGGVKMYDSILEMLIESGQIATKNTSDKKDDLAYFPRE